MKALGMLLIIWGHCFPIGLTPFIYSFSVPLFFIISGYLTKNEPTLKTFFTKNFHTLIIPYILLCIIKDGNYIISNITDIKELSYTFGAIIFGFHTLFDAPGAKNLWFVYSLFLIKFLFQLFNSKKQQTIMTAIFLTAGIIYNYLGLKYTLAATNSFLAMPYFYIGYILGNSYKEKVNTFVNKLKTKPFEAIITSFIIIVCIYYLSKYNGSAWMYRGNYGNNILIFYFLGYLGTLCIFVISALLDSVRLKAVTIISAGTILILQFHRDVYHPLGKIIKNLGLTEVGSMDISTLIASIIVILAFVPIILIVKKLFPILIGRRHF